MKGNVVIGIIVVLLIGIFAMVGYSSGMFSGMFSAVTPAELCDRDTAPSHMLGF